MLHHKTFISVVIATIVFACELFKSYHENEKTKQQFQGKYRLPVFFFAQRKTTKRIGMSQNY